MASPTGLTLRDMATANKNISEGRRGEGGFGVIGISPEEQARRDAVVAGIESSPLVQEFRQRNADRRAAQDRPSRPSRYAIDRDRKNAETGAEAEADRLKLRGRRRADFIKDRMNTFEKTIATGEANASDTEAVRAKARNERDLGFAALESEETRAGIAAGAKDNTPEKVRTVDAFAQRLNVPFEQAFDLVNQSKGQKDPLEFATRMATELYNAQAGNPYGEGASTQEISAAVRDMMAQLGFELPQAQAQAPGGGGEVPGIARQGLVVDGMRFKGGNPNDEKNWEPVQ